MIKLKGLERVEKYRTGTALYSPIAWGASAASTVLLGLPVLALTLLLVLQEKPVWGRR